MKHSMNHFIVFISLVVVCAAAVLLMNHLSSVPSRDSASLSDYVYKHEASLIELIANYPNQYRKLNGHLGIEAIDTREEACTCFIFPWSYDIAEGSSYLYYACDGVLEILDYTVTDTTYIDGLGINGRGYINCTMLKQNWFFVESYLPT